MSDSDMHKWVEENVLTIAEAAEYMNMTRQGVYFALGKSSLKAIRGKFLLKDDLDEYMRVTVRGRHREKQEEKA